MAALNRRLNKSIIKRKLSNNQKIDWTDPKLLAELTLCLSNFYTRASWCKSKGIAVETLRDASNNHECVAQAIEDGENNIHQLLQDKAIQMICDDNHPRQFQMIALYAKRLGWFKDAEQTQKTIDELKEIIVKVVSTKE